MWKYSIVLDGEGFFIIWLECVRVRKGQCKNECFGPAFDDLLYPDPGGLKRAKRKEKTEPKDRKLGIKSIKSNVIRIKMSIGKCDYIFIN
jgi:hypothetical protein